MTSATVETFVIGDTDGSHTGDAGEIQWTAYLTDDKTAGSASPTLDCNGRNFLTFRSITFVGSATDDAMIYIGKNVTFTDCTFLSVAGSILSIVAAFGVPSHFLMDRCRLLVVGYVRAVMIRLSNGTGSDYDADIIFRNCLVLGGVIETYPLDFGGSNEGGGVIVRDCTLIGSSTEGVYFSTGLSATIPGLVYNCLIIVDGVRHRTRMTDPVTEDYNVIYASGTAVTGNVTSGGHSITDGSYAPLIHIGQELQYGAALRPFGMPSPRLSAPRLRRRQPALGGHPQRPTTRWRRLAPDSGRCLRARQHLHPRDGHRALWVERHQHHRPRLPRFRAAGGCRLDDGHGLGSLGRDIRRDEAGDEVLQRGRVRGGG